MQQLSAEEIPRETPHMQLVAEKVLLHSGGETPRMQQRIPEKIPQMQQTAAE
jgi:hypothetical protein